MRLHLDLEGVVVRLVAPNDLDVLEVVIDAPADATPSASGHRLSDVVAARHLGVLVDPTCLLLDRTVLEFLAAGEVPAGWSDQLASMAEGADGRLRCRVVWPTMWSLPDGASGTEYHPKVQGSAELPQRGGQP